jgi:hypothetical protein
VTFDGEAVVEKTRELDNGESTDRVGDELPDDEDEYDITVEPDSFEGETPSPENRRTDCGTLTPERLLDEVLWELVDDP